MAAAAAAAQSVLPVSQSATSAIAATPAARAFFSKLSEGARNAFAQRRPWLELVDRSALSKPESLSEATARVRKNWAYFRMNYVLILLGVLAFSLVSHPISLLLLVVLTAGWVFLYLFRTEPLVLFSRTYSDREALGIMALMTIVVVFLTSVGSLIISALMFGLGIVALHGAFRAPEDLFMDDQEPAGGFLSFLTGGSAQQQPAIVTRV